MARWFYGFPCVSCNCVPSFIAECGDTIYGTLTISSPYFDTVVREFSSERTNRRQTANNFDPCRSFVGGWGTPGVNNIDMENASAGLPNVIGNLGLSCANSGINIYRPAVWRLSFFLRQRPGQRLVIPRTDCAGTIEFELDTTFGCFDPPTIEISSASECPDLPYTITFDAACFASASAFPLGCPAVDFSLIDIALDMSFAP
jgi:hypothetical protein